MDLFLFHVRKRPEFFLTDCYNKAQRMAMSPMKNKNIRAAFG